MRRKCMGKPPWKCVVYGRGHEYGYEKRFDPQSRLVHNSCADQRWVDLAAIEQAKVRARRNHAVEVKKTQLKVFEGW
jgi:hypothetical protein